MTTRPLHRAMQQRMISLLRRLPQVPPSWTSSIAFSTARAPANCSFTTVEAPRHLMQFSHSLAHHQRSYTSSSCPRHEASPDGSRDNPQAGVPKRRPGAPGATIRESIYALASGSGRCGLSVVRLSGPSAGTCSPHANSTAATDDA